MVSPLLVRKAVCKFSKTILKFSKKKKKSLYWMCGFCAYLTRNRGIWHQTLLAPCSAIGLLNPVLVVWVAFFAFCFWFQALWSRSACANMHMERICTWNGWLFKMNLDKGRGLIKNVGLSRSCFYGVLCLQKGVREWGGNIMETIRASL